MKKLLFLSALFVASLLATAKTIKPANSATSSINKKHFDEGVKVVLVLDDKTYDLATYNLSYVSKDKSAAPTIATYPPAYNSVSFLSVSLRTSKVDQALIDWILSPARTAKEGKVIITDSDSGKTKTLILKGVRPAGYSESFYNGSNVFSSATTSFSMNFEQISIKL